MRKKDLKRKVVVMAFNILLFHFTIIFSTYGQVGLFERIELNRLSWPHIKFTEGGVDVARIQGVDGRFAVTSVNGADQLFTVNTSDGNAQFLTDIHRFYINGNLAFAPEIAGIRNNAGNPVINSKNEGILYLNRDVNADVFIQSKNGSVITEIAAFLKNGDVGIGTATPNSRLDVAGKIHAREVKVSVNAGADFVFNKDYKPKELYELEAFIAKNQHLPDISPEKEMLEKGLEVGEFQIKLLQKIEELTLYIIDQEKRIRKLEAINTQLMKERE